MGKITISNINWAWDRETIWNYIDEYSKDIKEILVNLFKLSSSKVEKMNENDMFEQIYDALKHNRVTIGQMFDLPETVELDGDLTDDEITDYLSDEYGFYIDAPGYIRSDDDDKFVKTLKLKDFGIKEENTLIEIKNYLLSHKDVFTSKERALDFHWEETEEDLFNYICDGLSPWDIRMVDYPSESKDMLVLETTNEGWFYWEGWTDNDDEDKED